MHDSDMRTGTRTAAGRRDLRMSFRDIAEVLQARPMLTRIGSLLHAVAGVSAAMTCTISRHAHALRQEGCTGLIMAAQIGHEAVVRLLLERGAAVDKATQVGRASRASPPASPWHPLAPPPAPAP